MVIFDVYVRATTLVRYVNMVVAFAFAVEGKSYNQISTLLVQLCKRLVDRYMFLLLECVSLGAIIIVAIKANEGRKPKLYVVRTTVNKLKYISYKFALDKNKRITTIVYVKLLVLKNFNRYLQQNHADQRTFE